jgi:hypothetical protein
MSKQTLWQALVATALCSAFISLVLVGHSASALEKEVAVVTTPLIGLAIWWRALKSVPSVRAGAMLLCFAAALVDSWVRSGPASLGTLMSAALLIIVLFWSFVSLRARSEND